METISLEDFQSRVNNLHGKELETAAFKKLFTVMVRDYGLEFLPASSDKPRRERWKYIGDTLEQFAKEGSFSPGDYKDVSRNASYVLRVLREVLESRN